VYRFHFATGEMELDTENPGDVGGWTADNDLEVRAAEAMLPGGWQEIRIRHNAQSPWRPFQRWGPEDATGGVAGFSPDNRSLWLISSVDANTSRLLEVDTASGDARVIAEDPQYDVGGAMEHPRTHALQAVTFVRARAEWQILDESIRGDFAALACVHDAEFQVVSRDLDDRVWIVAYVSDDVSPAYYVYQRETRTVEFLFAQYPELANYTLARMEPLAVPARDGLVLHGYLTMPVGVTVKAPMVLLVHGGPWVRDTWGYNPLVQMLANRGYGVLQINYRGSTGYGKAHLNAGDREWGAKMHDDLLDARKWAVERGYADPNRFCIMGGSYGGYAVRIIEESMTRIPAKDLAEIRKVAEEEFGALERMASKAGKKVGITEAQFEQELLKYRVQKQLGGQVRETIERLDVAVSLRSELNIPTKIKVNGEELEVVGVSGSSRVTGVVPADVKLKGVQKALSRERLNFGILPMSMKQAEVESLAKQISEAAQSAAANK